MRQKIPKIDGLSFAISRLVHLVATLLEQHFAVLKLPSPHDHAGLDLRVVDREVGKVVLQITPRGWKQCLISASFYRSNRIGDDWQWNFGGGGIVAPGTGTIIGFEPMRNPSGHIVLRKIIEPARKVPLAPADFALTR